MDCKINPIGFYIDNVTYMDEKLFKSIFYKNWPGIDGSFWEEMMTKMLKSVWRENFKQPHHALVLDYLD